MPYYTTIQWVFRCKYDIAMNHNNIMKRMELCLKLCELWAWPFQPHISYKWIEWLFFISLSLVLLYLSVALPLSLSIILYLFIYLSISLHELDWLCHHRLYLKVRTFGKVFVLRVRPWSVCSFVYVSICRGMLNIGRCVPISMPFIIDYQIPNN